MKKIKLIILGLVLVTACIIASVMAVQQKQMDKEITIDGYVKDKYGNGIPNALVEVYINKIQGGSATTNVEGYYTINFEASKKNVKVTVSKEGYKTANRGVHLSSDTNLNLTMLKINENASDKAVNALQYIGKKGKERNIGCKVAPYKNNLEKGKGEIMKKQGQKLLSLNDTNSTNFAGNETVN